jgi:hypothetical protein
VQPNLNVMPAQAGSSLLERTPANLRPFLAGNGLARIFHQDADLWVVAGEPDRARPAQPIDHSIGQTGMPEMAVHNEPETA